MKSELGRREPLAVRAAILAVVQALVVFGVVEWGDAHIGAITAVVETAVALGLLVWWGRSAVTPVADPHDAAGKPLVAVDATEAGWLVEDLPEGVEAVADDEVPVADGDD